MLKLVGTHKDGTVADERVLITDENKPTTFLIGLALIVLGCNIAMACILGKTIFRKK